MAAQPIACIGDTFKGICEACGEEVTGTLTTGEFIRIDGHNICVTGSVGIGSCGHSCRVVGQSTVMQIEGKNVARLGDPVTDGIDGIITSGSDLMATE